MNDLSQVQAKTQAILARLAQEPKAFLEPLELYPRLVSLLKEEAGYQNCALLLADGDGHLAQVAALGLRSNGKQQEYPLPYLCLGQAQVEKDIYLVSDVEALPMAKRGSYLGRGSLLAVLLKDGHLPSPPYQSGAGEGVIGALVLEDERVGAFSAMDCQLLQNLAGYFAKALEVAQHYQRVREMALYDELTGLHNRHFFYEHLAMELERADRTAQPISLAIIDLDRLKRVNDIYDHLTGDRALKTVAQVLAKNIRAYDVLVRYGGDEFVLVMPATPSANAEQIMIRLVTVSDRARLEHLSQNVFVPSFSYGLAAFPQDGKTYEEIFAVADKRLYQAKAKKGIYSSPDHQKEVTPFNIQRVAD